MHCSLIYKILSQLWLCVGWVLLNPISLIVSNRTDFFQYRRLLKLRFFCSPIELRENSFYGHSRAIRSSGGTGFGAKIEHGVFFAEKETHDLDSALTPMMCRYFRLKRIYTFSERRRRILLEYLQAKGLRMDVVAVGPYILFARHFLSDEKLFALKHRLGRILLVYPQHSTEDVEYNFDTAKIIARVQQMRRGYDTVLVSLYWMDIIRGMADEYEAAGYVVVCSGRREDPNFLSRQKDVLTLADRVLSNAVGTHVGYAVAMGKPCTLFRQQIKSVAGNDAEARNVSESKHNMDVF